MKNWKKGGNTILKTGLDLNELKPIPGRVGFGKYPLSKWEDLPREYLEYLISKDCKTTIQNKGKAKQELINRTIKYPVSNF